ncbi:MAG: nucleoside diphosphate kinase regulator [Chthoniobacterales bacterium]
MNKSISITTQDQQRLQDLLAKTAASGPRQKGDWKALAEELRRAVIVQPNEILADVITMNSRADLIDLDTNETVTFTLVFPQDAWLEEDKISVLAPIGAGMLGYRVGDEFEWRVPQGVRRMKVARVHYQPEAAGDFTR